MNENLMHRFLLLPLLSFGACAAFASEPGNVRIEFVHPERFTDFRINGVRETESAQIFRDQVSSYLSPVVTKRFPGSTLSLSFTDIDLAGRLEPWLIRNFNDVRFDRDNLPLRLYFEYALADSKGKVVAGGKKSLMEAYYLNQSPNYPDGERFSTLFYEKVTLSRWLNSLTPSGSRFAGK